MNIFKTSLLLAVGICAVSNAAKADYAVWTDVKTGAKVSFPDTWKQINNQQPNDLITLSLPSGDDKAVCRLRADDERRFLIYPSRFEPDVRDVNFTQEFWDNYTASYDQVNVIRAQHNAGLGRGFASMTLISFVTPPDEPRTERAGIMAVTNYYDKLYVAECTSGLTSYRDYHQAFLGFFKSINFKKAYTEATVGNYRNFLNEWGTIDVPFPNAVSRSTY
ncbi:MAG: hypothetical protein AAB276_09900 [Pseudomonadota bacterium]